MAAIWQADAWSQPVLPHVAKATATIHAEQTAAQAVESLRSKPLAERIVYFYVLDETEKLIGVVPTRRLLVARPDERIRDLMVARIVTLRADATVSEACETFVLHRFLALPVVDGEGRLLGTVDVGLFTDEMIDVGERREADDVFQLMGIHAERARTASALGGFNDRFPWLLANVAGGIGCAFLAGRHEAFLDSFLVLALFVPVVLALSESVAIQSATITIQSLHGQTVDGRSFWQAMRREAATATLLGVACGALVGSIAWIWKRQALVAVAIGSSIAAAMLTSCLLGVLFPTILRAFRRDPRIASGPIVLASADVATLLLFFQLSASMLEGASH